MPEKQTLKDFEEDMFIVFGLGKDDRIVFADEGFARFCGVERDAIIGRSVRDFLHPYLIGTLNKTGKNFIEFVQTLKENKIKIEFCTPRKETRKTLICEFRSKDVFDRPGSELLVIGRNAEKEKRIAELIEFQKLSSRQLGSGVFDMMVSIDSKLCIKQINRECEKKLDVKGSKLIGKHINLLLARDRDEELLKQAINQTLAFQNAYNIKLELKVKDRLIHTLVNIQALRDDFNNEIGYSIFIRDIEDELKMVSTLQQIEKMGALGNLAAGIAHQVKNYIQYVSFDLSHLEVQVSDLFPDRTETRNKLLEHINEINRRIVSLGSLMQHLLEYAKNQETPVFTYGIVNNVIKQVLELVQDTAKMRGAVIVANLSPDIPPFFFSPVHLEQAIVNIVSNAIDAVPEKHGEITIISSSEDNFVSIKVIDNGVGIPEKFKPHIFETFQTTKPPGKGTGLGLTVALQMVALFNGTIDFDSTVGKGTTFTIRLPIKRIPEIIQ